VLPRVRPIGDHGLIRTNDREGIVKTFVKSIKIHTVFNFLRIPKSGSRNKMKHRARSQEIRDRGVISMKGVRRVKTSRSSGHRKEFTKERMNAWLGESVRGCLD
jgi:hypothetical protein